MLYMARLNYGGSNFVESRTETLFSEPFGSLKIFLEIVSELLKVQEIFRLFRTILVTTMGAQVSNPLLAKTKSQIQSVRFIVKSR